MKANEAQIIKISYDDIEKMPEFRVSYRVEEISFRIQFIKFVQIVNKDCMYFDKKWNIPNIYATS